MTPPHARGSILQPQSTGPRNKGTSKRSPTNPCGEEGYPSVFLGNTLACRTLIILMIIHALHGFWLLEQPRGSMMELLPVFQAFLAKVPTFRHSINMSEFGAPSKKTTWLYSGLSSEQISFPRRCWRIPVPNGVRSLQGRLQKSKYSIKV